MLDAQKTTELRGVIAETPGEFSFSPATSAGRAPDVTCILPSGVSFEFRAEERVPGGIAVTYARRLAACANEMPHVLDELDRLRKIEKAAVGLVDCFENDRLIADVRSAMNLDTEMAVDALIAAVKGK